jgi:hypothetical protein
LRRARHVLQAHQAIRGRAGTRNARLVQARLEFEFSRGKRKVDGRANVRVVRDE